MDQFHQCFVPEVRKYLASKELSLKVLILDNTPGHPKPYTEGIEVVYLPPKHNFSNSASTSGGTKTFKAYYTLYSTERTVNTTDENSDRKNIMEVWKDRTIEDTLLL